jgi:hypothetical protein
VSVSCRAALTPGCDRRHLALFATGTAHDWAPHPRWHHPWHQADECVTYCMSVGVDHSCVLQFVHVCVAVSPRVVWCLELEGSCSCLGGCADPLCMTCFVACLQPLAHITAVALQLWPYDGPHHKPRVQPAMLVGLLCGWGCWRRHPLCTGDMWHCVNDAVFACSMAAVSVGFLSLWC